MAMGAGPTPAAWQADPQKGWSPKKGTMNVGLPAGVNTPGGSYFTPRRLDAPVKCFCTASSPLHILHAHPLIYLSAPPLPLCRPAAVVPAPP